MDSDPEKTLLAMEGKCRVFFCLIWQGDIALRKRKSITTTLIYLWLSTTYPDAQLKTPLRHKVFAEIEGAVCYRCQARCHSHRLLHIEMLVMAPKHLEISLSRSSSCVIPFLRRSFRSKAKPCGSTLRLSRPMTKRTH